MAAKTGMSKSRLPLKDIDEKNKKRIRELNGEFLNLYRVLGHHAKLLSAWIEFAYTLRRDCTTTRTLRELMILRGAQWRAPRTNGTSTGDGPASRGCLPNRSRTFSSGGNRRGSAPPSVRRLR